MVMINDMIELSGALPTAGTTLTTAAGDLVDLDEALDFSLSTPTQIVAGDTVIIDGTLYTVTLMIDAKAMVTYDGGASTAAVTAHGITLDDGSGGTLSYLIPADDGGDLPDITQIEIQSVNPALNIQVSEVDGNEDVTLDIPPDYIVEGTSGADTIDAAYMGDPEGDQIDNNDGNPLQPGPAGGDNDSVEAGAGDDSVSAGLGDDTVLGEAGNDTLFGGDGTDEIHGGDDDDVIAGDGGNDTLYGDAGDDTIFGDAGADSLLGGDGADQFWDGAGNDYSDGGADADVFYSNYNVGDDTIVGGETGTDDDTLISFKNADSTLDLTANGTGADNESGTLTTSVDSVTFSEIESITLSSGDDSVIGSAGDDNVDVSTGADTIDGGAGDDTFNLGAADGDVDTIVFGDGDGNDDISGFEGPTDNGDGTFTGNDQLDVSGLTSDGGTTPVDTHDVTVTDDGSGNAVLTFAGGESITLIGIAPSLVGSPAGLEAMGIPAAAPESIYDAIQLDGLPGDTDLLIAGTEMLQVDESLDFSTQTAGQLSIGDNVTIGGTVYSITGLHDYEADMTSSNGGVEETVHGHVVELDDGAGGTFTYMLVDDSYGPKPDITQAQLLFVDPVGPPVLIAGYDSDQNVTLTGLDFTVDGTGGADVIDATYVGDPEGDRIDNNDHSDGSNDDSVFAGAGDDSIVAGAGDDTVFGQDGADTILGGAGNDHLDGDDGLAGEGADSIDGGTGNDTIIGDGGNDTLLGGDGDDQIFSSGGNNLVDGGDGADQVFVGDGNDSITVDQGDTIDGGGGDDYFTLQDLDTTGTGNAAISITGGEGNETGGDTLQLTPDVTYSDITFSNLDDAAGGLSGSFTMADGTLVTFSEIENIICFTPGMRILTDRGERPVETLLLGDMVVTRDNGLRPIRWIGKRTVPGKGKFAPVLVGQNATDGARRGLLVSPQHRILFTGYRAELLFGEPEVLVAAKHLVDGRDVQTIEQDAVTYIHVMFDTHEVIYAEGVATESFHAGDIGLGAVGGPAREELFAIFPELRSHAGGHGDTVRMCLKGHEARLMVEHEIPLTLSE